MHIFWLIHLLVRFHKEVLSHINYMFHMYFAHLLHICNKNVTCMLHICQHICDIHATYMLNTCGIYVTHTWHIHVTTICNIYVILVRGYFDSCTKHVESVSERRR